MSYTVVALYDGFPRGTLDRCIERAARRACDGSGFGMGQRDMTFPFATRRGADNAVSRIEKIAGVEAYCYEEF